MKKGVILQIFKNLKKRWQLAKEFCWWVRKIEKILRLPPIKLVPGIETAFWPPPLNFISYPIFWWGRIPPRQTAIHEVRHRIQVLRKENSLPLLAPSIFSCLNDKIPPEIINEIKKELGELFQAPRKFIDGHLEEEIDAIIAEILGTWLLKEGRIKEFKNLMLLSQLPSFFIFIK